MPCGRDRGDVYSERDNRNAEYSVCLLPTRMMKIKHDGTAGKRKCHINTYATD